MAINDCNVSERYIQAIEILALSHTHAHSLAHVLDMLAVEHHEQYQEQRVPVVSTSIVDSIQCVRHVTVAVVPQQCVLQSIECESLT